LVFGTGPAASSVPASIAVSAAQSRSGRDEGITFNTRRPRTVVLKASSLTTPPFPVDVFATVFEFAGGRANR
jgi:hypothetical protein